MPALRSGVRSGIVLGVVLVFLVLIGFSGTLGTILGDALGRGAPGGRGDVTGVLVVLGLMGAWAGLLAARRDDRPTGGRDALLAGGAAGLAAGVVYGAFVLALGLAREGQTDLRPYLAELSPQAIDLAHLGLPSPRGPLLSGALLLAGGLVGGGLAGFARSPAGRGALAASLGAVVGLATRPALRQVAGDRRARLATTVLLLALAAALPQNLGKNWNYTLGTVGIYILMGLGLNIVVGLAGLLDLGYVAFFAVGAYTVGLLTAPQPMGLQWSFWVVLPLAVVLAAATGVLLGIPVLRLRGDYLAIVTLGFGEIIRVLVKSDLLADYLGGPQGIKAIGKPSLAGWSLASERAFIYLIAVAIVAVVLLTWRLQASRVGRSWVAMREDETVARATGINVYHAKLLAFAIGAAFAGLGGGLFASRNAYTGPEDHTLMVSINVLCLVIVGGMGSVPGVVVGAFVLKGLPEALRPLQDYRLLVFGALLVTTMVLRPGGLWPSARRRLEAAAPVDGPADGAACAPEP